MKNISGRRYFEKAASGRLRMNSACIIPTVHAFQLLLFPIFVSTFIGYHKIGKLSPTYTETLFMTIIIMYICACMILYLQLCVQGLETMYKR